MRRAASFHRDRVAVIEGERSRTFAEVWERGLRLANGLAAAGLQPGDRVAVLEDNGLESADFFTGTAAGNFVRVPLYRRNSRESHRHMLASTESRALVVTPPYLHEVEGLADGIAVIVRDESYEPWLAAQSADDPDPDVGLDDLYVIRHSAGTEGKPKGIAFSHRRWMNTERDWVLGLPPIQAGDHCQHAGPISHGSGYLFLPVWLAGGASILEPKFDAERTLELLQHHGGYFFAVPTMLADLARLAEGRNYDFSGLKAIVVSAAPIRRPTAEAAHALFGDRLYQLYGQTEAVPVVFMGPEDWFATIEGSDPMSAAGRVMPFAELEIRGEENEPLPVGETGEIAVRCDGQMDGIWRDPELTARRLVDGWVLTGDIGRLDANGFLYVVDRKDDMIISGGFNIWPAELETVISELAGVREVAVFGVPAARWGETPHAVVVVAEDCALTDEDVRAACVERLGSYKKPSSVELRTEPLPRSPVGKILRRALRDPHWAGQERSVAGA
ncbi:MAG TPA: AMP-binding protein [Solirubrobacteraceae bacterium]|jgi:acyl-CoA synthetase (AMP-forming)/AMP-acid ligase II|nr:AMP-binding protein [Solirubrobacteraceae bacterium]